MSSFTVRAAESGDLLEIPELKLGAYSARGYCSREGASEQYLVLNENEFALVAVTETDEVVGSMVVTKDRGKIYADEVFEKETAEVRKTSRQIAYYGTFAVPKKFWRFGNSIGEALIREAIARAIVDSVDAGICIVNPRHVKFYIDLGFTKVATCDNMPGLIKAPAVMMVITGESGQDLLARFKSGAPLLLQATPKKLAA